MSAKSSRGIPELLSGQAAQYPHRAALVDRSTGRVFSYAEYALRVAVVAEMLRRLGVRPGDRVGIWARNCPEWLFADLGIQAIGGITVPAHEALPLQTVLNQFAHAGVKHVFVGSSTQQHLRTRFSILDLADLPDGSSYPSFEELESGALATIVYTSGTTGEPKGVMLTHGNLLSNCRAAQEAVPFVSEDVVLNWLPFSHIYARSSDAYRCIVAGCTLALATSTENVLAECREERPTILRGVPRFYEKAVRDTQSPELLRESFGGRIRYLFVGGASLTRHVEKAFQEADLTLLQGYGLTETSPTATVNRPGEIRIGTVGRPVSGCECRISEDGEILIRGPIVTPGYWAAPEETRASFQGEWLRTGDLGAIDESGYVSVFGRKNELIVLSTGKKVMPGPVEELLCADPWIDQAVVMGEGRSSLTALVVPTDAGKAQSETALRERTCALTAGLAPWEQVRSVVILERPLSTATGELTVNLKLRRSYIAARYLAGSAHSSTNETC